MTADELLALQILEAEEQLNRTAWIDVLSSHPLVTDVETIILGVDV